MVGGVAAFLASAFPAVASATDYCVAPVTGCSGTPVQHFEDALGAADGNADADRIFLGATTYVAPTASGFDYNTPNARVEIIGQGRGQTILTSPAGGNSWVLRLVGGPGTSIHDLTIRLPQSASAGLAGLWTKNTARRVDVVEDSTQANPRSGVELVNGGVLEDSKVTLSGGVGGLAARFSPGGATVRRSELSAWIGVMSDYGGTIERSRITGLVGGVNAERNLTTITGSLIRLTQGSSTGIVAATNTGFQTVVNADGVTIVGPGVTNTAGASALTQAAESANVSLTNSVVRGVSETFFAGSSGGQAKIAASYSDYDPGGDVTIGPKASIAEANVSNVGDSGFADPAGGDYRLLPGSPLVDPAIRPPRRVSTSTATRSSRTGTATASRAATWGPSSCSRRPPPAASRARAPGPARARAAPRPSIRRRH